MDKCRRENDAYFMENYGFHSTEKDIKETHVKHVLEKTSTARDLKEITTTLLEQYKSVDGFGHLAEDDDDGDNEEDEEEDSTSSYSELEAQEIVRLKSIEQKKREEEEEAKAIQKELRLLQLDQAEQMRQQISDMRENLSQRGLDVDKHGLILRDRLSDGSNRSASSSTDLGTSSGDDGNNYRQMQGQEEDLYFDGKENDENINDIYGSVSDGDGMISAMDVQMNRMNKQTSTSRSETNPDAVFDVNDIENSSHLLRLRSTAKWDDQQLKSQKDDMMRHMASLVHQMHHSPNNSTAMANYNNNNNKPSIAKKPPQ